MATATGTTLGSRLGWYAAWLGAAPFAVFGSWYASQVGLGYDSHAYWSAVQDMGHLYGGSALSRDAYLYSPLFAQAIWPLVRLPWPVFGVIWSLVQSGLFVWLLPPCGPMVRARARRRDQRWTPWLLPPSPKSRRESSG